MIQPMCDTCQCAIHGVKNETHTFVVKTAGHMIIEAVAPNTQSKFGENFWVIF